LTYPVVYFLPGFGSNSDGTNNFFSVEELASLMSSGQIKEMIIVVPNGANVLHGSFYANSPVTGNWEDFITKDVVDYIDSNYRTIPKPEGRGIGGHSMGGFGAFNLAMRHPDIFGASYSISPTFFDKEGLANSLMFDREKKASRFLEEEEKLAELTNKVAIKKMSDYDGAPGFTMAYGAAFAPNPDAGPPFFDYPYKNVNGQLQIIKPVWDLWQSALGDWPKKIAKYHDNLMSLHGIVIDYGTEDHLTWIPEGSEYLSKQLTEAGIPNTIYSFEGGHSDRLHERLLTVMLPFFSSVLKSPGE
jgi:S-formylglutathione hydrolase FrmB